MNSPMYCIQYLDYDEGSAARWNELPNSRHESREAARAMLKRIRALERPEWDDTDMRVYRVVEVGSELYYSQPSDKLEW